MECVQKQQTIVRAELSERSNTKIRPASKQTEIYDKEAAEFRSRFESEKALRQLRDRSSFSAATAYRTALMR
jgi:hypothetical protein